ncbi:MAG: hypothetical protein NT166_03195 [Candidatus Aminicenantes bacterium]|nr:hypothetical protein [Candidatus Aminicenantes bacterium]
MKKIITAQTRKKSGSLDEPGTKRRLSVKENKLKIEGKLKRATEYLKSINKGEAFMPVEKFFEDIDYGNKRNRI